MENIVLLLRGFFSTPVISSLGRLGVLDAMKSTSPFTVDDFQNIPNKELLQSTFHYLARLGFIESTDKFNKAYKASGLGKEVFRRASSFYVPHSYFEYMHNYHQLIQNPSFEGKPEVERLENVIGSGKTHQRYFPPVISFLKRKVEFEVIADIGCGDGHFLTTFLRNIPGKRVAGIDISKLSIEAAYKNLNESYGNNEICMVCSDALDVEKWSEPVLRMAGNRTIVISMWFLLHEISRNKYTNIIEFLIRIRDLFPDTPIVIGEIVRQTNETLSKHSFKSVMPEYLFFHEISGQGILTWEDYQQILINVPYDLEFERLFDENFDNEGNKIPSSFVWCLMPK